MYHITHSDENIVAKVCHSCKKITLGRKWRSLVKPLRDFVIFHEEAHAKLIGSEVGADKYAIIMMEKKGYPRGKMIHLLLSTNLRTTTEMDALKEELEKS